MENCLSKSKDINLVYSITSHLALVARKPSTRPESRMQSSCPWTAVATPV